MKISPWCVLLVTGLGAACCGALTVDPAWAETLRMQGSAGFAHELMEPYKGQIEAVTGYKLKLTATTSPDGLVALVKGKADLAMIWAPLNGVVALLRKSHPDLPFQRFQEFPVGKTAVAYSVNPGNPVRYVSIANLREIMSGHIGSWRDLGGPDVPIHVVSLRTGGGSRHTTEQVLFGGEHMTPGSEIAVESDRDVLQTVAHDLGALGISRVGAVVNRLPSLRTNVPVQMSFSIVTLDEPTDAMREVIVATRSVVFGEGP